MIAPSWLKSNVSRETLERLKAYISHIEKWNPRINLISKSSLVDIWERHIWDSVQIVDHHRISGRWMDLGSGGGLPGIVLAILAKENAEDSVVQMVESDQRKCAFLRTVSRELALNTVVTSERIESLPKACATTISARALTDLNGLLAFAEQHLDEGGFAIFPKGEAWKKEIKSAQENWSFEYEAHKSHTNPNAVVLKIKEIARV